MPTNFYEGRLLETPENTKSSPDDYWGIDEINDVTIRLDDHDHAILLKNISDDFRNKTMVLWRFDENESSEDQLQFETCGKISSYNFTDVAEITIVSPLKDKLQTNYPRKVYEVSDWSETRPYIFNPPDDLGKPYPLCFGRCEKVPAIYVHCDFTNNLYDYILCRGPIKSVSAVYRNKLKVPTTEYSFYDGSQSSPYPGYAFIRFVKWQVDSATSNLLCICAGLKGNMRGATLRILFTAMPAAMGKGYLPRHSERVSPKNHTKNRSAPLKPAILPLVPPPPIAEFL